VEHILETGVAMMTNEDDKHWCVECWVHVIVIMADDMRVYITAEATTRTSAVSSGVYEDILINAGRFDCFSYSVESIENDVLFGFSNFQGNADLFIARRNEPSTPASSAIRLSTPIQYPRQILIVTKEDRNNWSAELGQYYLCAQSYAPVSAQAFIKEDEYNGVFDAHKDHLYTFLLQRGDSIQLMYEQDELALMRAEIHVEASVWTTGTTDLSQIKVFYTICLDETPSRPCYMEALDANGSSGLAEQLELAESVEESGDLTLTDVTTSLRYKGKVQHDPAVCSGAAHAHLEVTSCKYIFSIYNPSASQSPRRATFIVPDIIVEELQHVEPGRAYRNVV